MKTQNLCWLLICAFYVAGCKPSASSAISGVYVTAFKQEFSTVNDTLIIDAYNLTSKTYKITRRSGYRKIRNGRILPKEFEQEKWMATFEPDDFILQETDYGRQIYFRPDLMSLSFGASYHKIN